MDTRLPPLPLIVDELVNVGLEAVDEKVKGGEPPKELGGDTWDEDGNNRFGIDVADGKKSLFWDETGVFLGGCPS